MARAKIKEKLNLDLLKDLQDAWLNYLLAQRGLSQNSIQAYSSDVENFLFFIEQLACEISLDDQIIVFYLSWLRSLECSERTAARHLASLRSFFLYAQEHGQISDNPAELLHAPKLPKTLPEVLTREEISTILALPRNDNKNGVRDRCILEMLYACGARVSEICSLNLADIDRQVGLIRVFGKGAKERGIPLHGLVLGMLEHYINHWREQFRPKSDCLFPNRDGEAMSRQTVWKIVKKYTTLAGIQREISPHTFRHSFATHLLEGGADLRSVQLLLGHTDISATEHYLHVQTNKIVATHRKYHPRNYDRSNLE